MYRPTIIGLALFMTISIQFAFGQDATQEGMIKTSVYFGGGSYYISPGQAEALAHFLSDVKDLAHYEIGVFSHTDNIGGAEYNKWLSERRSEAVIEQLKRLHVPKDAVKKKDWGQQNPLYDNETHQGRIRNRRVDIILSPLKM